MRELGKETSGKAREKKAIELDRDFHAEICALARNDFLTHSYRQVSLRVNMSLIHKKTYHQLEAQYAESHAEILQCLEQDPAHAMGVLKKHFKNVTDLLLKNGAGARHETSRGPGQRADKVEGNCGRLLSSPWSGDSRDNSLRNARRAP